MKQFDLLGNTMKSVAACAMKYGASALITMFFMIGCANITSGVGISLPIGPFGSVGVGVNSNGTASGSLGVGVGPATVSVGTSGQLPGKTEGKPADKTPSVLP
jgi:hypothetical protein